MPLLYGDGNKTLLLHLCHIMGQWLPRILPGYYHRKAEEDSVVAPLPLASTGTSTNTTTNTGKASDGGAVDPAKALREKLASLAAQSKSANKPEIKRFRRGVPSGSAPAKDDPKSSYLMMVQKLKSAEKEDGGTGGKWLVR